MIVVLKSTLAVLAVFGVLLGILSYGQTLGEAEAFERAAAEDVLITARSLRPVVEEVSQVEGLGRARQALERANASLPQVGVRWTELGGDDPREPARLGRDGRARLAAGQEVTVLERGSDGVNHIYVYAPIFHGGSESAALEVSRTLVEESAAVRAAIAEQIWGGVALAVGGTVVASLIGLWFIGRPMRALVEQARRIGEGDFAYRSSIRQRDEVGFLARELDAMSDRLAHARDTLAANNEERIRVLEQLRHADRLTTVGTLAAGVAHELGTPLNVAGGHAKMIASGTLGAEQAMSGAKVIGGQVERMVRILRQLLDFARRGESAKRAVDLRAIAARTVGLLDTLARGRGLSIELACADAQTLVLGDGSQLEQVFTNLIMNAIQAMENGVVRVRIERREETPPPDHGGAPGEFLRVDVCDEGTGIDPKLLPRVFEPFFTTKPVGEGTGLGLSVAYGIVRDHGGWMSVTSEPGAGTVFSVHLPPCPPPPRLSSAEAGG